MCTSGFDTVLHSDTLLKEIRHSQLREIKYFHRFFVKSVASSFTALISFPVIIIIIIFVPQEVKIPGVRN